MDHTLDDRQLESHIFDTSDSMDLSKQYFTTLQLLRIARQRIETHRIAWEELRDLPDNNDSERDRFRDLLANDAIWDRLHNSPSTYHRVLSTLDTFVLSEGGEPILNIWEEQRDKVTQLFKTRARHLTERIDQKTKEVESLRDGVCPLRILLPPTFWACINSTTFGSLTLLDSSSTRRRSGKR